MTRIDRGSALLLLAVSCSTPDDTGSSVARANEGWLQGDVDERFALVSRHLRGFDLAMVEVGYRYTELYWAGNDRNWAYADYQLEKIETAVANGVQRRPKRADSARMLEGAVASVRKTIEARDSAGFAQSFAALTATCNTCHQSERVAFMTVVPPTRRASPIRASSIDETGEQDDVEDDGR
jgi:hypothetical protein